MPVYVKLTVQTNCTINQEGCDLTLGCLTPKFPTLFFFLSMRAFCMLQSLLKFPCAVTWMYLLLDRTYCVRPCWVFLSLPAKCVWIFLAILFPKGKSFSRESPSWNPRRSQTLRKQQLLLQRPVIISTTQTELLAFPSAHEGSRYGVVSSLRNLDRGKTPLTPSNYLKQNICKTTRVDGCGSVCLGN